MNDATVIPSMANEGPPRVAGVRADLVALVLGALAAAALPPFHFVPALLVAVPGLLALIGAARGPAMAFRRGFWFGFGHHLLGLYWITDAILIEAARYWWFVPLAVPGLAALLAVFIAVPAALARLARPGWRRLFVLAGAWTLADLARQFVLTGFPWNPWGSAFAFPGRAGDLFLQAAAVIGTPGLTLAVVLLAGLPTLGRRGWLGAAAGLALWAGFGAWRLSLPAPPATDIRVVLVQGDIPQGMKWSQEIAVQIFHRYLDLTARGVTQAGAGKAGSGKVIVVWPESASPFLLTDDSGAREAIAAAAGTADVQAPALIGSLRFDDARRPRNSLVALDGAGAITAIYDKWHLVPGGEYQPGWIPLPVQLVPGGGFAPGPGPRTLHLPGIPAAGPLICYEAIFPGEITDPADRPEWLVNITNDAWFGDSTGPRQHLAAARMRAVEAGLPLVRAANTGISAAFDARGHELVRLGLDRSGAVVVELPGALPPTPFSRYGLAIPGLLAVLVLMVSAGPLLRWTTQPHP